MENTLQSLTYFNRHESMDSTTRSKVLDLISDLQITENCNADSTINMLYGLYDGYDYGDQILAQHTLLNCLNDGGNTRLVNEILAIVAIVKDYPRTEHPNNNNNGFEY